MHRFLLPLLILACSISLSQRADAQEVHVFTERADTLQRLKLTLDGRTFTLQETTGRFSGVDLQYVPGHNAFLVTWNETHPATGTVPHFIVSLDGQSLSWPKATSYDLLLRYQRHDPRVARPAVPAHLDGSSGRLWIVQYWTQGLEVYRNVLRRMGAEVHLFMANNANVVEIDPALVPALETLPFVRSVSCFHPAYKLEEQLLAEQLSGKSTTPMRRVDILTTRRGPAGQRPVSAKIAALGGRVESLSPETYLMSATVTHDMINELARMDAVQWIDRWGAAEEDMDIARAFHGADFIEGVTGYTGAGVRVEVLDGGCNLTHGDLQNFAVHGTNTPSDHGTACSGIVLGSGAGNFSARGAMPDAFLIVGDYNGMSGSRYNHTAELQNPALTWKAVLQTNSWGSTRTTQYTAISQDLDLVLFDHDRISITQSQSNAGNQDSRPQAWAKNVISVGGIRHYNTLTKSDDAWSGGASIGPAADGRIKPDISSFYDNTLCTDQPGAAGYSSTDYTCCFGGTSGATPIVAGHLGLLYQMWGGEHFNNSAPGATVFDDRPFNTTMKALLINTATQWSFSGVAHDLTRVHQGWGHPDLQNAWNLRNDMFIVDESDVLTNLSSTVHTLTVPAATPALRATLVFRDNPGTTSSSQHRINDLDLKVTSPGGTVYWGNNGLLAGNWSTSGGSANTLDTVENVFVQNPQSGTWLVEVIASELNQDNHTETPQLDADYALVVTGVDPGVAPSPDAEFSGTPTSGVSPLAVSFTDQSTGNVTSWSWSFGDGGTSTQQNPSHTYTSPGTYAVSLTVDGPQGPNTENKPAYVAVTAPPPPGFSDGSFESQAAASPPTTPWTVIFGTGHTVNPDGVTTDNGMPSDGSQWCEIAADSTNGATPPTNPGGVTSPPVGGAGVSQEFTYATGQTVLEFEAAFVRSESAGSTYNDWMSVDVSDGATTWNVFFKDTFSTASATSTKYGDAMTAVETVSVDLAALFPSSTTSTTFTVTVQVGNGNDNLQPSRGYVDAFRVAAPASAPTAEFAGAPTTGIAPLGVSFTDQSTGTITTWSWSFGDGGTSTAQSPSHTYTTPGTYTVSLTVTGPGGSDTETKAAYVTVGDPPPVAEFAGTPTTGIAPLGVSFTDQSTGTITTWSWSFGDGGTSTAQSPSHTYTTPGTYTVSLTVTGPGGSDTETKAAYVTVGDPPPVAEFAGTPTTGIAPLGVSFTDQSTGTITTWSWSFGDGGTSTAQSPSHTYTTPGTYTVSLTVTGPGGSDTETKAAYVTVGDPPPVAEFAGTPTTGIAPLGVSFTDQSTGTITTWSWSFGDGGTSTAQSPSHTYTTPGTYTVSLTVTGPGGSDTETKAAYVTVGDPPPVAEFAGTPTTGIAPLGVSFTDQSTGTITTWSWSFGDGGTSTAQSPSHTYTTPGTYTVSLTVTGPGGSDTETKADHVTVGDKPLYLSLDAPTNLPGLGIVQPEDVVHYDDATSTWSMHFDGSDVGLSGADINALQVFPDGSIVMSLSNPTFAIPGLLGGPSGDLVESSDLVYFAPTSTGTTTSGLFLFVFDGSDADLAGQDIDGLFATPEGYLLMSLANQVWMPTLGTISPEDLIFFFPTALGSATTGVWIFIFDGSGVGLSGPSADIDAIHIDPQLRCLFSIADSYSLGATNAEDEDIGRFTGTYGFPTTGTLDLHRDLSLEGLTNNVNALTVGDG